MSSTVRAEPGPAGQTCMRALRCTVTAALTRHPSAHRPSTRRPAKMREGPSRIASRLLVLRYHLRKPGNRLFRV